MDVPSTDLVGNFQKTKNRFSVDVFSRILQGETGHGHWRLALCGQGETDQILTESPHGVGGWVAHYSKVMKIGWVGYPVGLGYISIEQLMMQENRKSMEVINRQCFPGYSYDSYAWIYLCIYLIIYLHRHTCYIYLYIYDM